MALEPNALTTLAAVKEELQISVATDDAYLERLINAASDFAESYCNRSFFKETGRIDFIPGYGTAFMVLPKAPVVTSPTAVVVEFVDDISGTTLVDPLTFTVHDANAGLLFRSTGWTLTASRNPGIVRDAQAGTEDKDYKVTYDCGFQTPEQGGARTLPFDLEDAVIRLVTDRFNARGRDQTIKSERLLSWNTTYGNVDVKEGVPATILASLDKYKRVPQAVH